MSIVTVFLIVTAVMNIALGYGLAVYLGRTRASDAAPGELLLDVCASDDDALFAPPNTEVAESLAKPNDSSQFAHGAASQLASGVAENVAAPDASLSPPVTEAVEAVELEQDVLAGIEEFRNQLAQMKAQPLDAVLGSTLAPAAARD